MFITIKINSPVVGAVNWSVVQVLWKDCAQCEICQKRLLFKVNKGQQKRQSLETRKWGHITVAGYPAQVVSLLWALMSSWIFNNVSDSVTYFRKPNRHLHKKGVYPDSSIRITVEAHKKKIALLFGGMDAGPAATDVHDRGCYGHLVELPLGLKELCT